ncbi:MAG: diguanylate cyclase [Nitrospirota bacterium]|nr:diguanylate cyclase [Nitrospirota bacterium]
MVESLFWLFPKEGALVKWGYEIIASQDGRDAWEILQQADAPRMAILDWMMPELDGLAVCQEVRKRDDHSYTYLLLLTSNTQKAERLAGLHAGADDYLTKPVDLEELRVRLQAGRRILDLETKLLAAQDSLREQATHDALTGLWNRAAIVKALEQERVRANRERTSFGVVLADLDGFKLVNDGHGHLAGDRVLEEAARRMRTAVRAYDVVGRYGGEEFLIVCPGCHEAEAVTIAERIRASLERAPIEIASGEAISVTLFLGVTMGGTQGTDEPIRLIKSADTALYCAKNRGGNCVELAIPDIER